MGISLLRNSHANYSTAAHYTQEYIGHSNGKPYQRCSVRTCHHTDITPSPTLQL